MLQEPEFSFNALLILTRRLTELVGAETDLLKQMKISEIAAIQLEKNQIAGLLEVHQNQLRRDAELRASLTLENKQALREAAQAFDEAILVYQKELFKARKVNELVIGKMMEVVKEHVTKNRTYNSGGTQIANGMELARNTPAIKFNAQV